MSRGPVAIERDRRRTARGTPQAACPAQVEQDRREPAAEPQLADPRGVVRRQRPVGANQGVLGGLLGVARIAQHPQGDRVHPVLVRHDERIEGAVEVAGEVGGEAVVRIHQPPEPRAPRNRCMTLRYPGHLDPGRGHSCDNPGMGHDDRYDDLIASLGGFHRSWLVYLGHRARAVRSRCAPPATRA